MSNCLSCFAWLFLHSTLSLAYGIDLLPFLSHPFSALADEKAGGISLTLSCVWTGDEIPGAAFERLQFWREEHPDVHLIHFLSPSLFVNAKRFPEETRARIQKLIWKGDGVGVYFAPWLSLTQKAGVAFRSSPTFWGSALTEDTCAQECGIDVPLGAYSDSEVETLLKSSRDILRSSGVTLSQMYMVAGWSSTETIRRIAAKLGWTHDFSPIPPSVVEDEIAYDPLFKQLSEKWGALNTTSQPIAVGEVLSVPQNGGLLEYLSTGELVDIIKANQELSLREKKPRLVATGFLAHKGHFHLDRLNRVLHSVQIPARFAIAAE